MSPAPPKTPTFEQRLTRLEKIVTELQSSELTLEQSVKLFEEGMTLVADCRTQLDAAEAKVEILVKGISGVPPEAFALNDLPENS